MIPIKTVAEGCKILCKNIAKLGFKPSVVVSLGKGGMFGSYFIAKLFDIPVFVLNIKHYDEKDSMLDKVEVKTGIQTIKKALTKYKNILIFDDLVDSGHTMLEGMLLIRNLLNNTTRIKTSVLYKKEASIFKPDFVYQTTNNSRIEFDYEKYLK